MNKLTILSAATLLAFAAGAAAGEKAKPMTDAAATPAVEVVTDAKVATTAAIDPAFTALDKDGDASLLQTDFPTGHDLSTDLFASFDTDRDQRISAAEFSVYAGGSSDTEMEDEEEEAE